MSPRADNAIIMAAGISSRFAPLSHEKPKALIPVRGEALIERQLRQLREAGIDEIVLVVGYKKEQFEYLREKWGVLLVENPEYETRNNNSSIFAARRFLKNSYICSSDNYFSASPFEKDVEESYYAAVYSEGPTKEWCIGTDSNGWIRDVKIGGADAWYMLGHAFWSREFSRRFIRILEREYGAPETAAMFWEDLFISHLDELPMKIRRYPRDAIFEFDSLDELREFDPAYREVSGSAILAALALKLGCPEGELTGMAPVKAPDGRVSGFTFDSPRGSFRYNYADARLEEE